MSDVSQHPNEAPRPQVVGHADHPRPLPKGDLIMTQQNHPMEVLSARAWRRSARTALEFCDRFRQVSTIYPRMVFEAYGGATMTALADDSEGHLGVDPGPIR